MVKTATRFLLAGLLCLALWQAPAHGESPELMDAYNRFNELYAEGRYNEAALFGQKVLALVKEAGIGPRRPGHLPCRGMLDMQAKIYLYVAAELRKAGQDAEAARLGSRDRVPDHSWLSRSRTRVPHEVHEAQAAAWRIMLDQGTSGLKKLPSGER